VSSWCAQWLDHAVLVISGLVGILTLVIAYILTCCQRLHLAEVTVASTNETLTIPWCCFTTTNGVTSALQPYHAAGYPTIPSAPEFSVDLEHGWTSGNHPGATPDEKRSLMQGLLQRKDVFAYSTLVPMTSDEDIVSAKRRHALAEIEIENTLNQELWDGGIIGLLGCLCIINHHGKTLSVPILSSHRIVSLNAPCYTRTFELTFPKLQAVCPCQLWVLALHVCLDCDLRYSGANLVVLPHIPSTHLNNGGRIRS